MAITWDFIIKPLDVSRKEASIMAVRTDDTDPQNILNNCYFRYSNTKNCCIGQYLAATLKLSSKTSNYR